MSKLVLFLATLIIFSDCSSSQPKLSIDNLEVALGVMYNGNTKSGRIGLKNIGNQPLKILRVQPSCGCTTVKQPKSELQPNESDIVEISFNATMYRGLVEKYVNIETNDPSSQYVAVKLTADVREELFPVMGSYSIWLGEIPAGKTTDQSIAFCNATKKVIAITEITSTSTRFSAESDKQRVSPSDTVRLTIHATAEKSGYDAATVRIQTDSKNQPSVELKVYFIGKKAE